MLKGLFKWSLHTKEGQLFICDIVWRSKNVNQVFKRIERLLNVADEGILRNQVKRIERQPHTMQIFKSTTDRFVEKQSFVKIELQVDFLQNNQYVFRKTCCFWIKSIKQKIHTATFLSWVLDKYVRTLNG